MYQRSSYENGVAMPIRQGLGDMDFSAIYQFINESVDSESKE
jgi:hypothetical protein